MATEPGSILQMAFDTLFLVDGGIGGSSNDADAPAADAAAAVELVVTFLSSYEHMGQAEVSCVSGCLCSETIFEGHLMDAHHSVPSLHTVPLTWPGGSLRAVGRDCIVQVGSLLRANMPIYAAFFVTRLHAPSLPLPQNFFETIIGPLKTPCPFHPA